MDFYDTKLSNPVLDALDDMNFTQCTPIQEHAIPSILDGRDVLGVAQTGTGKTAAYLLPVLSELSYGDYPADAINCVIMSPTRELAQQIDQAMQGFAYYLPDISSIAVYGGNDGIRYEQEKRGMQFGADVVIATPGRLISHISLGNIDLSRVSFFILDEADRMLDMGFSDDILKIANYLPKKHQTIMFSATMPEKIRQLARTLLDNPVEVSLAVSKPVERIHQMAYICYERQKIGIISELFSLQKPERVIIFSGSKQKTKYLYISLSRKGFNCRSMHSDLTQNERDEVMFQFRAAKIDILVATDIVARGIDIDDITLVVNYDVPRDAEDYVHRIGRTARAGAGGSAVTLVSVEDQHDFSKIENFLGYDVEKMPIPQNLGLGPKYERKANSSKSSRTNRRHNVTHNRQSENKVCGHRKKHKKKNFDKGSSQSVDTQNITANKGKNTNKKDRLADEKKS